MKYRFLLPFFLSLAVAACGGSSGNGSDSEDNSGEDTDGTGTPDNTDGDADNDTGADTGNDTSDNNDGGENTISGNVQFIGLVSVDEDVTDNEVDSTGSFIRYTSGIAGNLFEPIYTPQLDVCTVETFDISIVNVDFPDIDVNVVPELVSAGEVVPLTSNTGSYIQLVRQSVQGFLFYSPEPESVPGPIPSQLTLDIPGDVFPAFSNVNMPVVQSLIVTSPTQGEPITPSTSFSWTAGSDANAYISISATTLNTDGTTTIVECEATDDGQFTFPTQTQSEMGTSFSSIVVDYQREALTILQQENALLVLSATSGN